MNMDYSKAFELLGQDVEKERNDKADKAVHNNLYNKGYRQGYADGRKDAELYINNNSIFGQIREIVERWRNDYRVSTVQAMNEIAKVLNLDGEKMNE